MRLASLALQRVLLMLVLVMGVPDTRTSPMAVNVSRE